MQPVATDEMLSRLSITFHYVQPGEMLMFDFLLYRVQRAGRPSFPFVRRLDQWPALLPLSTTPSTAEVTTATSRPNVTSATPLLPQSTKPKK